MHVDCTGDKPMFLSMISLFFFLPEMAMKGRYSVYQPAFLFVNCFSRKQRSVPLVFLFSLGFLNETVVSKMKSPALLFCCCCCSLL